MAHAAFAFVLGVALGLVIRRTLPAMVTTFALYAEAQIVVPMWIRSHRAATDQTTVPIEPDGVPVSIQDGTKAIVAPPRRSARGLGHLPADAERRRAARPRAVVLRRLPAYRVGPARPAANRRCIADLGALRYKQHVTYQPARRELRVPSMGRDRALPWPRPGPDRILRLVDPPPSDLTAPASTMGAPARVSRVPADPRGVYRFLSHHSRSTSLISAGPLAPKASPGTGPPARGSPWLRQGLAGGVRQGRPRSCTSTRCCFSRSRRTGVGEEALGRGPARARRAVLVQHQPPRHLPPGDGQATRRRAATPGAPCPPARPRRFR